MKLTSFKPLRLCRCKDSLAMQSWLSQMHMMHPEEDDHQNVHSGSIQLGLLFFDFDSFSEFASMQQICWINEELR